MFFIWFKNCSLLNFQQHRSCDKSGNVRTRRESLLKRRAATATLLYKVQGYVILCTVRRCEVWTVPCTSNSISLTSDRVREISGPAAVGSWELPAPDLLVGEGQGKESVPAGGHGPRWGKLVFRVPPTVISHTTPQPISS